eukprot:g8505.t1 g8505   contig3:246553-248192(-)
MYMTRSTPSQATKPSQRLFTVIMLTMDRLRATFWYTDINTDKNRLPLVLMLKFLVASPCRTESTEEADFFIVPSLTLNPAEMNAVMTILSQNYNNTLRRRGMKDHIVLSLWNPRTCPSEWTNHTKALLTPMVKVVTGIYVWTFHFFDRHSLHCGMYSIDNLLAVPYVSNAHEFKGDVHHPRPFLSMFIGSTDFPKYRRTIKKQCIQAMEEKGDCYSPTLIRGEESKQPSRYDMYVNATFFFCPSGDSFTRKALFDGLALNSIPVIFEDASLDVTYPQYFPGNPRDYSVLLNTTEDMMGQLRSIPKEEVRRMQSNIARIRESLSYSSRMDTRDATWVMMKELEKYKQNGYRFDDPFANKTELKCIKERFVKSLGHKNKTCKMQGDFPAVITENATYTGTEVNAGVLQTKYRILCTSDARSLEAGSYQARCVMFKHWVDRCAPSDDLVLEKSLPETVEYNTMQRCLSKECLQYHNPILEW